MAGLTVVEEVEMRLADILIRHNIVDPAAIEDPDGYDGGVMLDRILAAERDIKEEAERMNRGHGQKRYSAARKGGNFFGVVHADNAGGTMDRRPDGQSQQAVCTTKRCRVPSMCADRRAGGGGEA
jgi:hypothetical protein